MRLLTALVLALLPATVTWNQASPGWTDAQLRAWRGAISMPVPGLPYGPRPGAPDNTLFTAQGYDSVFDAAARAKARAAFRAEGYTHWPYGPLLQKGYHGWWPDTDFRADPSPFLARASSAALSVPLVLTTSRSPGVSHFGNSLKRE